MKSKLIIIFYLHTFRLTIFAPAVLVKQGQTRLYTYFNRYTTRVDGEKRTVKSRIQPAGNTRFYKPRTPPAGYIRVRDI